MYWARQTGAHYARMSSLYRLSFGRNGFKNCVPVGDIVQGIGVGGEWGGSVLLTMEWSRHHGHRGVVASWPQFGVPAGLFLANLSILAFSALSGDQFATRGWRIPFVLSIILIGVGLWIRLGILETPVFQQLLDEDKIEKAPIIEVFKKQPKESILSALLHRGQQAPFYIFTAFIFAYAIGTLHMSRNLILSTVLVASCVSFFSIPLFRHMSDLIGRRKTYLIGAVATGLFGFLYFGMVDTAYQLASVIAGGPAPSSPPRCSPPIIQVIRSQSTSLLAQW